MMFCILIRGPAAFIHKTSPRQNLHNRFPTPDHCRLCPAPTSLRLHPHLRHPTPRPVESREIRPTHNPPLSMATVRHLCTRPSFFSIKPSYPRPISTLRLIPPLARQHATSPHPAPIQQESRLPIRHLDVVAIQPSTETMRCMAVPRCIVRAGGSVYWFEGNSDVARLGWG
jgi:hypothetical protein